MKEFARSVLIYPPPPTVGTLHRLLEPVTLWELQGPDGHGYSACLLPCAGQWSVVLQRDGQAVDAADFPVRAAAITRATSLRSAVVRGGALT